MSSNLSDFRSKVRMKIFSASRKNCVVKSDRKISIDLVSLFAPPKNMRHHLVSSIKRVKKNTTRVQLNNGHIDTKSSCFHLCRFLPSIKFILKCGKITSSLETMKVRKYLRLVLLHCPFPLSSKTAHILRLLRPATFHDLQFPQSCFLLLEFDTSFSRIFVVFPAFREIFSHLSRMDIFVQFDDDELPPLLDAESKIQITPVVNLYSL